LDNRQELLDALAQVLRESAHEAGLQFKEDPVIKLAGDNSLPLEDFRVVASDPDAGGQTDVFAVEERIVREDAHTTNAYLILDGFQTYPLGGRVVNIGRRLGNHIVIDDPRVSRSHAQVRAVRGRYVLIRLEFYWRHVYQWAACIPAQPEARRCNLAGWLYHHLWGGFSFLQRRRYACLPYRQTRTQMISSRSH
jgi:hypothetical protein